MYGDFEDVINMIPQRITAYALNDINYIDRIINANKIHMTEIILGMYGYNYITNSDGKMELSRNIKELQENNVFKFILHNPFPNSKGVYDIILDDKQ